MLPRSGLRGDARFVHSDRKQRLAECVVHLVRAGMAEVLALQINFRAAEALAQIRGEIERRRTSHEFAREALELVAKFWIPARLLICSLELVKRGHQRLRDVLAAELAEVAAAIEHVLHLQQSS